MEGVGANTRPPSARVSCFSSRGGIVGARGEHAALSEIGRALVVFLTVGLRDGGVVARVLQGAHAGGGVTRGLPSSTSLAFTIVLSALVLKEQVSLRLALGAALMVGGALVTLKDEFAPNLGAAK